MNRAFRNLLGFCMGLMTSAVARGWAYGQAADGKAFMCPRCGCAHDGTKFTEPGRCPSCGMELVQKKMRVAIILYDGVQIIDFSGPYEVFGQAGFEVFTVSESGKPLSTTMDLRVVPTYSIAQSPVPDVLLVPGGGVDAALENAALMTWIRDMAPKVEHVMSVCNGAFILAAAGLLDGKSATTFYKLLPQLEKSAKKTTVVWDKRFVDNGRIVTSAGLSSGIDSALYVVSKIRGLPAAKRVALHLEYNWDPDSTYARGALADMHLPRLRPPEGVLTDLIDTDGDRDQWRVVYRLGSSDAKRIRQEVDAQLVQAGWKHGRDEGRWSFVDRYGRPWTAQTSVEPDDSKVRVRIDIHRKG